MGGKLADGSGLYAKTPDKTRIFTVASFALSSLDKKPFDLRDRDLLHVKRDAVKTLEIAGPEGGYALAKNDKGEWAFTKPLATLAGRWSVDGILGTVESLRMEVGGGGRRRRGQGREEVRPRQARAHRDPGPRGRHHQGPGDRLLGRGQEVVRPPEGRRPGRGDSGRPGGRPRQGHEGAAQQAAPGGRDLRDRGLRRDGGRDHQGLREDHDQGRAGLRLAKWKRTSPDAKDLETTKVEDALFKVGGIEVAEFLDQPKGPEAYGFEAPVFTLLIRSGAGKGEQKIEIGKKDGSVYARRPGDAAVLKLDAAKVDELIKAFAEL